MNKKKTISMGIGVNEMQERSARMFGLFNKTAAHSVVAVIFAAHLTNVKRVSFQFTFINVFVGDI